MTQVNIPYASSSFFQNQFQRNRSTALLEKSSCSKEAGLKTSNPAIFPSLHPFSSFYKERKNVHPNPFITERAEVFEPVKKLKISNDPQTVVVNTQNQELNKEKVKIERSDEEVFRVPKLPKRLLQNKGQNAEMKRSNVNANNAKSGNTLPAVPEIILQNIETFQGNTRGFEIKPQSIEIEPQVKVEANQNLLQNQNSEVSNQSINPLLLGALYEKLKMEYYSLKLRQSAEYFSQIYQANQELFAQNLKPVLKVQSNGDKGMLRQKSADSSKNTKSTSAKEENIKQGINW